MTVVEFRNDFPRIAAGLPDAGEAAVRQTAVEIAADARAAAPRDTGALAATCTAEPLSRGELGLVETVGVSWAALAGNTEDGSLRPDGKVVDYAIYQEFGTRFMAAQPFFFPAVEQARGSLPANIELALSVTFTSRGLTAASPEMFPGAAAIDLTGFA